MVHSLKEVEGEPELAEVKLGRGHACEIRIADISVSRIHAKIQLVNGKFLLFDNNSKFGTLVLLQK
jgi:pSer/pThr/pTyr-binding forkhead associated (FHA) protein